MSHWDTFESSWRHHLDAETDINQKYSREIRMHRHPPVDIVILYQSTIYGSAQFSPATFVLN